MIVERLTFRAKYGQGDTLVALFKEMGPTMRKQLGDVAMRIYTDLTGPMFTVTLETELADLTAYAAFAVGDAEMYSGAEFQAWFARMTACTESGERQLFNVEVV